MANFYTTKPNCGLLFYENQNNISMIHKSNSGFSQPVVLCSDYQNNLESVIYHNTIYYSYVNIAGNLIVNSILNQVLPTELKKDSSFEYVSSKLTVFSDKLFLFYITYSHTDYTYRIQWTLPTDSTKITAYPILSTENKLQMEIVTVPSGILLLLHSSSHLWIYQISDHLDFKCLFPPSNFSSSQIQLLQNQLIGTEAKIQQKNIQIQRMQEMIERATQQYNELMHVAEQYREEAIKWRSKFL